MFKSKIFIFNMLGLSAAEFDSFVDASDSVEYSSLKDVNLRVFVGGCGSVQQEKFAAALVSSMHVFDPELKSFPKEEYLDTDGAKDKGWGISEIVDWLLESDIHFILNHIHQGMIETDCRVINQNLQRLYHHPGFPNEEQLSCSIFQQDKFEYIRSIPYQTIPTLKIDIQPIGLLSLSDRETTEISRFMDTYDEGCGWHIKPPFTTNGEGTIYC